MKRRILALLGVLLFTCGAMPHAQPPRFHVLAFYTEKTEADHVDFARQAITFFESEAKRENFSWRVTTDWNDLNAANLQQYQLVVWLNDSPQETAQRTAFEQYMKHGGAWLGFHFAGYNDERTHWPWFVGDFLDAVFLTNSWPPLPAELVVEVRHPDPDQLVRIAWHLGNRHLPTEIRNEVLRIRPDHVIEAMLHGLGADLATVQAPFQPEGGAYSGHGHGHHHGHGDSRDHDV